MVYENAAHCHCSFTKGKYMKYVLFSYILQNVLQKSCSIWIKLPVLFSWSVCLHLPRFLLLCTGGRSFLVESFSFFFVPLQFLWSRAADDDGSAGSPLICCGP